jgi:hypothetical protein
MFELIVSGAIATGQRGNIEPTVAVDCWVYRSLWHGGPGLGSLLGR